MDTHRHHGIPSASVVRAVMPDHLHEAAMQRITDLEIADLHDVVVLPGAVEALASLAGAKNAIATSCTVPLAQARIAAAQLVPPSVLVTVDDVAHGKPHPDPFLEAARRLGVDPRRCLVVEDAPKDLRRPRPPVASPWRLSPRHRARRWTPMPSLLTFRRSGSRSPRRSRSGWRSSSMVPFEWLRS